jgi:hypothetical protein
MAVIALWLTYAAAAAAVLWLARRFTVSFSARMGLVLALLPLVFTGRAMLLGRLYGPADLYFTADPWKRLAEGQTPPRNPILSDLAFANLPWRAAVREAIANGRAPLWNRFVLGGTPLLGAAQAGVFHPSTWAGLWLPLSLSWTFSCTFTLFLALVAAYVFFRDFDLTPRAALIGAVGWGFSTYVVFWNGWSVGPSTVTFPLLLLGLRRLARGAVGNGAGLTAAALCLSLFGGHPESFFHGAAAGGVYFLWELRAASRPREAWRAVAGAFAAAMLALLLSGPQLFPLLETIPHSAEYRARRAALSAGRSPQSVAPAESVRRLLPDLLPFAHGIYGKSAVDTRRDDGSGMPLGYAGAVLFPLALLAFVGPSRVRGRTIFAGLFLAGIAYGASAPGLLDWTSRLPGFALSLNYRLVFLAGFGLSGLAALGADSLLEDKAPRRLAVAAAACLAILVLAFLGAEPIVAARGIEPEFARRAFLYEALPVALLAMAAAAVRRTRAVVDAALVYLVLQRFLEMRGTYPTLPSALLAPPLPTLGALPLTAGQPSRLAAPSDVLRPNASALYGVEDVRGYESLVLDRFAETFPLWCRPQAASFNRLDTLAVPFLSFLNVRYAIGPPDAGPPEGWIVQARGPELTIFANPMALSRAFVPRTLRRGAATPGAMASVGDFADAVFLSGEGAAEEANGLAFVRARESGPDLVVEAVASSRALVATSLPDWPGWIAKSDEGPLPRATINHAFVGFWVSPGTHLVRLRYRPVSWVLGVSAFVVGVALSAGWAFSSRFSSHVRRRRPPRR